MVTDYLLAAFTLVLAALLFSAVGSSTGPKSMTFMAFSFIITGIGAILGGTHHGFTNYFSDKWLNLIWKLTIYTIALSSFFFVIAVILSSSNNGALRFFILLLESVILIVYMFYMIFHDEFIYVILHYGHVLVIVVALKIHAIVQFADTSGYWILLGVAISIIGAVVQAGKISISDKYFNHNDLFHVVQMAAIYMFYRGALFFADVEVVDFMG